MVCLPRSSLLIKEGQFYAAFWFQENINIWQFQEYLSHKQQVLFILVNWISNCVEIYTFTWMKTLHSLSLDIDAMVISSEVPEQDLQYTGFHLRVYVFNNQSQIIWVRRNGIFGVVKLRIGSKRSVTSLRWHVTFNMMNLCALLWGRGL